MDNNNNNYFQGQSPSPQGTPQGQPEGQPQTPGYPPQSSGANPGYPPQYSAPPMQNQYGEVPAAIKKWNWGAFAFNIWWGIGNHAYLTLLMLVPCISFIWMFVCGAMGNQWAWKSGEFKDVEQFMAVQRTWNKAGLLFFIVTVVSLVILFISIFAFLDAILPAVEQALGDIQYY